jgi:hypothetical protein
MKKLRIEEAKNCALGHTAAKQQSQNLNLNLKPNAMPFLKAPH